MNATTIKAAIQKAKEEASDHFDRMKAKGAQISVNQQAIGEKRQQIMTLELEVKGLEAKREDLKKDLTKLKLREANIQGTLQAFETMLDAV